ncbi:MAG: glycosyltransferase family 39 protein [Candidatus Diapherotrites archaeon]|nr:glycosyltransferase family 39 protein [Candidatus Diapherotrites archaeon]
MNLSLDRDEKALLACAIAFTIVYAFFFPSFYSSADEHHFLATSLQLQQGAFGEKNAEQTCNAGSYSSNGYIYGQNIGRAISLIPFSFGGLPLAMLSGLLIHLLNFFILSVIFKKMKIRRIFALLYLFYPVIFWESRTLYAEPLVLTGLFTAFYFFISENRKHWALSGALMGLAVLSRYDAALGVGAILLALLLKSLRSKKWEKFVFVLAGLLPVALAVLLFNMFAYGSPLGTGYGYSGTMLLSSTIFGAEPISLLFYVGLLLAVYPLMLASPFVSKKFPYKLEFTLFSLAYLFLAARYPPFVFNNSVFTVLLRMRYALPLAGMLLIPYGVFLNELLEKFKAKEKLLLAGYWAIIAVLFAGSIYASAVHSDFLNGRSAVFGQIYSHTPENALVIGGSDDCMYFLNGFFPARRYLSVDLNQQLAGNPQNLRLENFIDGKTYVMDLRYSNREPGTGGRQDVTDAERKKVLDFIEKNNANLELVFETNVPHSLKIYKWVGEK